MQRATKIVATLGPASSTRDVLTRMLAAGVDVVRLNFSHGVAADHQERARVVREAAHSLGREVAIMADLQGPKIRIGKFADGKIELAPGSRFVLDAQCELGDATRVVLGGTLSNNKGINRMGGGLSAPALTTKDMDDVKTATQLEADYLAVSFPKSKEDMYMARQLMRAA